MARKDKYQPSWEKVRAEIEPLIIEKVKAGETNLKILIWACHHYPGAELNGKLLQKIKRKHGIKR